MLIFRGVRMHRGSLGRLVMSPALAVLSVFNGKSYIGESGASSTSTTGTRHRSWVQNKKKNEYATTRLALTAAAMDASVALWYFSFRVRRPSYFVSPPQKSTSASAPKGGPSRRQQESGATWGGKEGKEGAWAIAKRERERQRDKEGRKEGRKEVWVQYHWADRPL